MHTKPVVDFNNSIVHIFVHNCGTQYDSELTSKYGIIIT